MFSTDQQIQASIAHMEGIKQAMAAGKIAKNEADMKGDKPELIFSERTVDELLEAMSTIKSLRQKVAEQESVLREVKLLLDWPLPMAEESAKMMLDKTLRGAHAACIDHECPSIVQKGGERDGFGSTQVRMPDL